MRTTKNRKDKIPNRKLQNFGPNKKLIILPQSPTTGIFILTYPLQHYATTDGGGSADDGHGSDGGEMDIVCAEQLLAHSYTQNVK